MSAAASDVVHKNSAREYGVLCARPAEGMEVLESVRGERPERIHDPIVDRILYGE